MVCCCADLVPATSAKPCKHDGLLLENSSKIRLSALLAVLCRLQEFENELKSDVDDSKNKVDADRKQNQQ